LQGWGGSNKKDKLNAGLQFCSSHKNVQLKTTIPLEGTGQSKLMDLLA